MACHQSSLASQPLQTSGREWWKGRRERRKRRKGKEEGDDEDNGKMEMEGEEVGRGRREGEEEGKEGRNRMAGRGECLKHVNKLNVRTYWSIPGDV